MHTYTHTHTHLYTHVRKHIRIHTHYTHTHTHVRKHIHIHTCTHKYTHTRMYTYTDIPEGTSTEQIGVFTLLKVDKMSSNGALTAPLKLNPNMASMTTWYSLSISSGNGS